MSHTTPPDTGGRPDRPRARTYPTAHDLPPETRLAVVDRLNRSLADTTDLATQMKFAHWNVKGMDFYQLHLLFDEIAEVLEAHADTLAERATSLGGQAMGTVRMAAADSRIPEMPASTVTGHEFVEAATDHLAVHAATLRADIEYAAGRGDEGTADLYTELSREVDQQLYFLESHLQREPLGTVDQFESPQPGGGRQSVQTVPGQHRRGQPTQRITFGDATQQHPPGAQDQPAPQGQVQQGRQGSQSQQGQPGGRQPQQGPQAPTPF